MRIRTSTVVCLVGTTVALAAVVLSTDVSRAVAASEAKARTHVIDITDFKYKSSSHRLRAGDTVTWINRDIVPHTATANDKSWDTGTIKSGQSKSVVISKSFESSYFCRFHPAMKSTVDIE